MQRPSSLLLGIVLAVVTLGGCATAPPPRVNREPVVEAPRPPPATQVVFYPNAGQSPAQQDRDRYECYRWAVQQTGFDPSAPYVAPHKRVEVVSTTPAGANMAAGAVTGAVLGAAVSRPRDAGGNAIVGAIAGAAIGAAADANNQAQVERIQQRYDEREASREAQRDQQAATFRRAISACLAGRNYTVR